MFDVSIGVRCRDVRQRLQVPAFLGQLEHLLGPFHIDCRGNCQFFVKLHCGGCVDDDCHL